MATRTKKDEPTPDSPAIEVTDNHFDKPAATEKAEQQASKRAEEVAEQQKDAFLANVTNVPREAVATAYATPDGDKDPASITFALDGANVTVVATDKEMVFTRQDFLAFVRQAQSLVSSL